jgi:hypothetical protein
MNALKKTVLIFCLFTLSFDYAVARVVDQCEYYRNFDFVKLKPKDKVSCDSIGFFKSELFVDVKKQYYDLFKISYNEIGDISKIEYSVYTLNKISTNAYLLSIGNFPMTDSIIITFGEKIVIELYDNIAKKTQIGISLKRLVLSPFFLPEILVLYYDESMPSVVVNYEYKYISRVGKYIDKPIGGLDSLNIRSISKRWVRNDYSDYVAKDMDNNGNIITDKKKKSNKNKILNIEEITMTFGVNSEYNYHLLFSCIFTTLPVGIFNPSIDNVSSAGISGFPESYYLLGCHKRKIDNYFDVRCEFGRCGINNVHQLMNILYTYIKR